jgi:uncharacterized protein (TIGR03437 family)
VSQTGPVSVQLIANPGQPNELRSDMGTINLQSYAPALFTFNGKSVAALTAAGGTIIANPSLFAVARPAKPGEFISLFGTGFGVTTPAYQAGELASSTTLARLRDPLTVILGGTALDPSDIQFAGAAPGFISGLYQINIRIPDSAADGDLPISVQMGGNTSASGITLPVKR